MIFRFIIGIILVVGFSEQPVKTIPFKNQKIYSDIFQNIYVQNFAQLYKLDTTGKILNSYSNIGLGNILTVDVSNPLQILVFHNLYNRLQLLSSNLSPLSPPINLDDLGFSDVKAVCNSEQGGFWIYDNIKKQPVLINSKLEVVYYGTKVPVLNFFKMLEFNRKLYIGGTNIGLWEFDHKGNFLQFYTVEDLIDFFIYNQSIIFVSNKYLKKDKEVIFNFNETPESIAILKNHLVISNKDTLYFYKHRL